MNKRKLAILSFFVVCIVLIIGMLWYWESERWAEQKLQDYIRRLEDSGFTIQEHSLADFHVDGTVRIQFFSDFRSLAEQEGINHIYYDRKIHALYFLRSTEVGTEANIFYYK
jgi:hypothetical protein